MADQIPADELRRFHKEIEGDFQRVEAKIIAQIAAPQRPPRVLYHYTNMSGFRGIVETQKFWATDIRYLNDSKELSYSRELFGPIIASYLDGNKDTREIDLFARLSRTFDFREMLTPFVARSPMT